MAKVENRVIIAMACSECKEKNYHTTKNRKKVTGRLELNKYCPRCRAHHTHREAK